MGYYLLRGRYATLAKVWLIAFSLWFYAYFNIYYLLIMICSVLGNFAMCRAIRRYDGWKKVLFIVGIVANLGVLFYFKYFDFFLSNINAVFKMNLPLRNILLPLGISFFTFQQISFLHDVYDGLMEEVDFIDYALFVTFFPQLIAGPIVSGQDMIPQFQTVNTRKFDTDVFANGVYVFVLGLAKKVLIADTFSKAVDYGYSNLGSISSTEAVLVILLYTLQLYFDFSGYCDMAIGAGRMLGIEIAVNFNSPYKAENIIDFWKRWHITLSRFFTRNIYIPLGGNRKGAARMYFNLFIVFFLSGLWHGAGWNFVLWGCMHGALYVITRAFQNRAGSREKESGVKEKSYLCRCVNVLLTFAFVNIAWVFFRAASLSEAFEMFKAVVAGNWGLPSEAFAEFFNLGEFWYVMKIAHLTGFGFSRYILMVAEILLVLIMVFAADNVHELASKTRYKSMNAVVTGILLLWCIVSLSGVGTFLYFNF